MNGKPSTPLLIGIIVALLLVLGFFFYRTVNNDTTQDNNTSSITGTFNINGPVPNGATVLLSQKEAMTKQDFQQFASGVSAADSGQWTFPDAVSGKSYEITAALIADGKTITTADPIFISAPANDEVITFNVPSEEGEANAVISGTVQLNGYIPEGATVTLEGKRTDEEEYTTVVENMPAKLEQLITYSTAIAGVTYDVRGTLYDSVGLVIGQSNIIQVTAPAKNESLRINSSAQPPATPVPTTTPETPSPTPKPVSLSGSINFNGAAQQNTRIVVFQRVSGSGNNYQVAQDNISPQNGVTWQWNGATTGVIYDVLAVLKQRQTNGTDKDISTSNTITAAAPAGNEVFTLNSGYSLPQNNGNISSSCGNYNPGSNNWSASVTFGAIPNAQSYWIQIGTSNGGDELTNFTTNANNQTAMVFNYTLQNNTTYYARYAYAYAPNLQAYSSEFSPFSSTTSIRCSTN